MSYIVIIGRGYCNERGSGISYSSDRIEHSAISHAINHGFHKYHSDDFNIGKLENGNLVQLNWKHDKPSDDPQFMALISREIGL